MKKIPQFFVKLPPKWPKSWWIVGILFTGSITAAASTAQPLLVANIVDRLLTRKSVIWAVIGFTVSVGVIIFSELASKYSFAYFTRDLRDKWRHIIIQSSFSGRNNNQDVVSQSNNDVDMVIESYYHGRAHLLLSFVGLTFAAIALTKISPLFLALVIACAMAMLFMPLLFRKRIAAKKQKSLEKTAAWNRLIAQTLSGALTLYRRGVLLPRITLVNKASKNATRATLKAETFQGTVDVCIGSILFLNQLLIILFGWWIVNSEHISVGEIVAALQFEELLLVPMLSLTDSLTDIAGGKEIGKDLLARNKTLNTDSSNDRSPDLQKEAPLEKDLLLKTAQFTEQIGEDEFVLSGPALSVKTGEVVLLSGPSGSGKSLLLQILAGEIGSIPAQRTTQLAYVPAEEPAFGTALDYDILLGRKPTNLNNLVAEIDSASQRLQEMLKNNSNKGASLGERQRISLARAKVDYPKLWILDEAISHLDLASVKQIMQVLSADKNSALIVVHHGIRASDFYFDQLWEITISGTEHRLAVNTRTRS